ncbi:hypothetical protein LTR09_006902 [Extremus antarcticus]|uniref:Transmembrane protein n=1 Tax=Extremus antarcticus TaxID=702011 RepID=A0AAJ0DK78_9PEZI|nr:hypothetical protein LTR09_006902 [Extremus antarcticus]
MAPHSIPLERLPSYATAPPDDGEASVNPAAPNNPQPPANLNQKQKERRFFKLQCMIILPAVLVCIASFVAFLVIADNPKNDVLLLDWLLLVPGAGVMVLFWEVISLRLRQAQQRIPDFPWESLRVWVGLVFFFVAGILWSCWSLEYGTMHTQWAELHNCALDRNYTDSGWA